MLIDDRFQFRRTISMACIQMLSKHLHGYYLWSTNNQFVSVGLFHKKNILLKIT
jgi:hypothetical protein